MRALETTIRRLALCAVAAMLYVGCGADDDEAPSAAGGQGGDGNAGMSGGGASGEANGGDPAVGSGGTGSDVAESGRGGAADPAGGTGPGGRPGLAGAGGVDAAGGIGGSAGGVSAGGDSGQAGTGGGECTGLSLCDELGTTCDGDGALVCAADEAGCWVASRMACAPSQVCHYAPSGTTVECVVDGAGDACDDLRHITRNTVIAGESFATAFGDQHTFAGAGCALPSEATPEAVFAIDVPKGATILLNERGDLEGLSIDAELGIQRACVEGEACVAPGNGNDLTGLMYTAVENETVFGWVSSATNDDGPYRIYVEYLEDLGALTLGASSPTVDGAALGFYKSKSYTVELTEAGMLYGELLRKGSTGDVHLYAFDNSGNEVVHAPFQGDEPYAVNLPEGRYRLEVFAYEPVIGYELSVSAAAPTVLPTFDLGDDFSQSFGPILEGDSQYFLFESAAAATMNVVLTSTGSGSVADPEVYLFVDGGLVYVGDSLGETESFFVDMVAGGHVLIRVFGYPGTGDIPSLDIDVEMVPL